MLINHGDHLGAEAACPRCELKLALCYVVPFVVSMVSTALARRG